MKDQTFMYSTLAPKMSLSSIPFENEKFSSILQWLLTASKKYFEKELHFENNNIKSLTFNITPKPDQLTQNSLEFEIQNISSRSTVFVHFGRWNKKKMSSKSFPTRHNILWKDFKPYVKDKIEYCHANHLLLLFQYIQTVLLKTCYSKSVTSPESVRFFFQDNTDNCQLLINNTILVNALEIDNHPEWVSDDQEERRVTVKNCRKMKAGEHIGFPKAEKLGVLHNKQITKNFVADALTQECRDEYDEGISRILTDDWVAAHSGLGEMGLAWVESLYEEDKTLNDSTQMDSAPCP